MVLRAAWPVVSLVVAAAGFAAAQDAPGAGGLLLVANKGDHTLGIIDPVAGRQVARVVESGVTGHEVIASPDGRLAYVPIYGDSGVGQPGSDGRTMDVIDLASRQRVATIDFGRAERPHCAQFGPDGRLYVSTELSDSITVIDPKTNRIVERIPTGQKQSHMLVLSRDGRRAYTSNVGAGTLSIIDVAAKKLVSIVPISPVAQRIALSMDGRWIFTADQKTPQLAVVDDQNAKVARAVELPGIAYGTAPTPDGRYLIAALPSAAKVAVLDLRTWQVTHTIDVPKAPQEVLIRPDGQVAYVSCDRSAKIAEIDLAGWTVSRLIDAGPMADGLAWAAAAR